MYGGVIKVSAVSYFQINAKHQVLVRKEKQRTLTKTFEAQQRTNKKSLELNPCPWPAVPVSTHREGQRLKSSGDKYSYIFKEFQMGGGKATR